MPFKFEKLQVWQLSVELSDKVNWLCKNFPKDELFFLTSQLKRAADSVSLNIVEGSTGQSTIEFKRFWGYAIRSGCEVIGCLYLALKRKYIEDTSFRDIYNFVDHLVMKIQALKNSLK